MILFKAKDGGSESPVDGFFLIEWKNLFSIVVLRFNRGGREDFHSHAFNAFTWFLKGDLVEEDVDGSFLRYKRALKPKYTPREKVHRVKANKDSWCISIRGKWVDQWFEVNDSKTMKTTLTHGRKIVKQEVI